MYIYLLVCISQTKSLIFAVRERLQDFWKNCSQLFLPGTTEKLSKRKMGCTLLSKRSQTPSKKAPQEKVGKNWYEKLSKNLTHLQGLCKPCGKKGLHEKILVEQNGYFMKAYPTLSPTILPLKNDYA